MSSRLSYRCVKHALCNLNNVLLSDNVLLSIARLRRLTKDFKTLESYLAATCEVEFGAVGLLQKSICRPFKELLL